jgi:hypothetical protein
MGLTLAANQMDLIKKQAELVGQEYIESCDGKTFHEMYVVGEKLGEG